MAGFQANVIQGGQDVFNAMAYGQQHPGTLRFLESQVERYESMSNTMTTAARQFFGDVRESFNRFYSSEAMRGARAAVRKVSALLQRDEIRSLWDIAALQQAPIAMQRYVIACPEVRQFYNDQRCEGYSDTYVDHFPGTIGPDHYDYRRVMTGVVVETEDGGWKCSTYVDDLLEDDRELDFDEKADILSTWDIVRSLMKSGQEDPTSPYCSSL